MYGPLKLLHHSHSGRLRSHEHTSYLPLAFIVLVVGVVMLVFSLSDSTASADHPGPQAGSIGLTGTMPAQPPKTAAVITSPTSGQHFNNSPVTVSGTCPATTLVEIYKNDIFAGSTPCSSNSKFSLDIDPLYGQNILTAQVYDALNQAGPVSAPVAIYYDAQPPQAASLRFLNFSGSQLILETDAVYRGTFPGQTLNVPITILGGIGPYAINVEWGDSSNQVIPHADNTVFNASHIYKKPGTYKITLQGSDSQQQVAFLTVAAIVNGVPNVLATTTSNTQPPNKLFVLWPLYAIVVTMLTSFWLGERREKRIMDHLNPKNAPSLGPTPLPHATA